MFLWSIFFTHPQSHSTLCSFGWDKKIRIQINHKILSSDFDYLLTGKQLNSPLYVKVGLTFSLAQTRKHFLSKTLWAVPRIPVDHVVIGADNNYSYKAWGRRQSRPHATMCTMGKCHFRGRFLPSATLPNGWGFRHFRIWGAWGFRQAEWLARV